MIGASTQTFNSYTDGFYTLNLALPITLPAGAKVKVSILSNVARFCPDPTGFVSAPYQVIPLGFGDIPMDASAWVFSGPSPYPSQQNRIIYLNSDSWFECNGTPDGGIILAQPTVAAFKNKLHSFRYEINATDFRSIQALPIGSFTIIKDGVSRTAFIEELSYNNWNTLATVKLISSDATT